MNTLKIRCPACEEISVLSLVKPRKESSSRVVICPNCHRRFRITLCVSCYNYSYYLICLLQKDCVDLSKCPIGKWHRVMGGRFLYKFALEDSVDYICPKCSRVRHANKKSKSPVFCSKCRFYLGVRGKPVKHRRGSIPPEESRSKHACEGILKKHHEDLKYDDQRLSTKFIADVAGCSCARIKEKLGRKE